MPGVSRASRCCASSTSPPRLRWPTGCRSSPRGSSRSTIWAAAPSTSRSCASRTASSRCSPPTATRTWAATTSTGRWWTGSWPTSRVATTWISPGTRRRCRRSGSARRPRSAGSPSTSAPCSRSRSRASPTTATFPGPRSRPWWSRWWPRPSVRAGRPSPTPPSGPTRWTRWCWWAAPRGCRWCSGASRSSSGGPRTAA